MSDVLICTDTTFSDEKYCKASKKDVEDVRINLTEVMAGIKNQIYELQANTLREAGPDSFKEDAKLGGEISPRKINMTLASPALFAGVPMISVVEEDLPRNLVLAQAARQSFVEIASALSPKTTFIGGRGVRIGIACAPQLSGIEIHEDSLSIERQGQSGSTPYAQANVFKAEDFPTSRTLDYSAEETRRIINLYPSGCYRMSPKPGTPFIPAQRGKYCVVAVAVSSKARGSASVTRTLCRLRGTFGI